MMMTAGSRDLKQNGGSDCANKTFGPSSSTSLNEVIAKGSNSSNETVIASSPAAAATTTITTTGGRNLVENPEPMTMTEVGKTAPATATTTSDNGYKLDHANDSPERVNNVPEGATTVDSSQGPSETSKQRGKLKNFLMLTAHLNPFHNGQQQHHELEDGGQSATGKEIVFNENHLEPRASEELKSVTSNNIRATKTKHRSYLGLINLGHHLQRLFNGHRNHGTEFNLDNNRTKEASLFSKSAPVTPMKWRPLEGEIRANGYSCRPGGGSGLIHRRDTAAAAAATDASSNGLDHSSTVGQLNSASVERTCSQQPQTSGGSVSPMRPSVRFVDNGKCDGQSQARRLADDGQLPEDEATASLVAKLFELEPPAGSGGGLKLEQIEGECPMNSDKFRQYGYSLIDYISNYLDTIDKRRVTPLNIEPGYLKSLIKPDAPQKGESFASIMHDFENHIMCGITHWQHPHFHAYFPAGNAYPSILADMLSDALGCVGFSWAASPAYTELEIIMLDWMGKMIGLPDEFLCLSGGRSGSGQDSKGGGVIQGSASECVLVNLLAARHWAMEKLRKRHPGAQDGILLSKLIGYCSKEAHSCVEKAAMIGFIRMRALDTDEKHALRGETLARAMAADQANGLEPFIVCATLGTTSCVSFDNLEELGQVCQQHDVWLHVDAAYAGSALICPEFKHLMRGIERATSFNMNPNKWMLINFDCSLMWVKDRFKLTRAFVVDPLYLQHSFSDQAIDYRHWGIPLSRRFRALKLWFVIRNYGVEGLQAYIRNHVRLAKLFEQCIRQDARFSITNEVVLGLVCFRLVGSNALNQRLLSMINASGKLHMVPASLNGRYVIRFCVCDRDAKEADILYAYRCISEFATELFESIKAGRERIRAISQQNTIDVSNISLHRQQSASADRLNNMAHVDGGSGQPEDSGGQPQQTRPLVGPAAQQVPAAAGQQAGQAAPVSPREAARQYLVMRRNSRHGPGGLQQTAEHQTTPLPTPISARTSPSYANQGSLSAKSPLTKQASVQQQAAAAAATDQQHADEDLEQEIVLDSLATIDGYEYDLDDDDLLEPPLFGDEHPSADPATGGQQPTEQQQPDESNGWRSPVARHWSSRAGRTSRNQTLGGPAGGELHDEAEAEDEVFTLAERRQRMSLRYKREFFVRVVSDPRVYRASISGDINAHSSSCSLGGSQHQQHGHSAHPSTAPTNTPAAATTTTATTTSVPSATQSGETSCASDELAPEPAATTTPLSRQ